MNSRCILFCFYLLLLCSVIGCIGNNEKSRHFVEPSDDKQIQSNLETPKEETRNKRLSNIEFHKLIKANETFNTYFPDNIDDGVKLDHWWKSPFKTMYSNENIIKIIRNGFRRTKQDKTQILRWISEHYGTPGNFYNEYSYDAYRLMYYASFSPEKDVRDAAVRFGIGQHKGSNASQIYKRLLNLAIDGEHIDTVIKLYKTEQKPWKEVMMESIYPYLNSSDPNTHQQAIFITKALTNESDKTNK